MKKVLKVLLIAFITFIGIKETYASDFDAGQSFSVTYNYNGVVGGGNVHQNHTIPLNNNSYNYQPIWYTATGASGTSYNAYCVDPQLSDNIGSFTVDVNLTEEYKAGISAIMSAGGDDYDATRIAIVAFTYVIAKPADIFVGTTRSNDLTHYSSVNGETNDPSIPLLSMMSSGVDWACQDVDSVNTLLGISTNCESSLEQELASTYTKGYDPSVGGVGEPYASRAQSLFAQGLAAAAAVKNGENVTSSEAMTVSGEANEPDVNEDTVVITATMNIANMSSTDYLTNINFDCPTCSQYGLTLDSMTYTVGLGGTAVEMQNGEDTTESIRDAIRADVADDELASGTITLTITLTKSQELNEEVCTEIPFTITYEYSGRSNYNVAIIKPSGDKYQYYVVAMAVGDEEEAGPNTGTLGGANAISCTEKDICETVIETPVCEEDGGANITTDSDIKKCILDNNDDALSENSYQLSTNLGGVDNDYCQVFCKEDYKDVIPDEGLEGYGITLQPEIEDVVCGGYFQLKAHVEGEMDCYTGGGTNANSTNGEGSINKDQYLEDIENAQRELVEAINNYNEAAAKLEGIANAEGTEGRELVCNGYPTGQTIYDINVNWSGFSTYDFTWSDTEESASLITNINSNNSNYGESLEGDTYNGSFRSDYDCGEMAEDGSYPEATVDNSAKDAYDRWASDLESQRDEASATITTKIQEIKDIISDYNGCLTGWGFDYKFAQQIGFEYNEIQGTSADDYEKTTPYFDLLDEEEKYLEKTGDETVETEVVVCTGTASNEYVCNGNSITLTLSEEDINQPSTSGEYGIDTKYLVGDNGAALFEEKEIVTCSISNGTTSCETETVQISQASFVRKTIKKAQDYISPNVFAQTDAYGRITTVDPDEYQGNAVNLERIQNALPVSPLSVVAGDFSLKLEDLGQFYDRDAVGRLIDFDGDREQESVAYAKNTENPDIFNGNYACRYLNNCDMPDCPDCEPTGTPVTIVTCPDCEVTPCLNCIINYNKLQVNVTPITNNDVLSVERDYGYNWTINTNYGQLSLLSDKAELTIQEIEEANEMIYDDTKVGDENGLDFTIRLTPSLISLIKDYNVTAEGLGGYANDSLTCYDATLDETDADGNPVVVENLYCYSDLIDRIVEQHPESIPEDIQNLRTDVNNRSDDNNSANANDYWVLWPGWYSQVTSGANDEDGNNVIYNDTGAFYVIGGPAWK